MNSSKSLAPTHLWSITEFSVDPHPAANSNQFPVLCLLCFSLRKLCSSVGQFCMCTNCHQSLFKNEPCLTHDRAFLRLPRRILRLANLKQNQCYQAYHFSNIRPNPHWTRARKFTGKLACIQCEHSHLQQQVLFVCIFRSSVDWAS